MTDTSGDGFKRVENPTGEPGDGGVEAEEAIEASVVPESEPLEGDDPPTGHDTYPHP
jgi:hypothetical protein